MAGEGPNELGSWASNSPPEHDGFPGVIESLLHKVSSTGWQVGGAVLWKKIRKYRTKQPSMHEERNVMGAALEARKSGCKVLAFIRDRDGAKNKDRQQAVERGIARIREERIGPVEVIGGMAIERLESWMCALLKKTGTEKMGLKQTNNFLEERGVHNKKTADYTEVVEHADLEGVSADAGSLRTWMDAARAALRPGG